MSASPPVGGGDYEEQIKRSLLPFFSEGPMRQPIRKFGFFALVSTWMLSAPGAALAISTANELCDDPNSNPCVIPSGTYDIDPLSVLDFGSRDVELNGKLDVGSGFATILAGSLTMLGNSQLKGVGAGSGELTEAGGSFIVRTTGDIIIDSGNNGGAVRLNGFDGGDLDLISLAGSITGSGDFFANAAFNEAAGGFLTFAAFGDVILTRTAFTGCALSRQRLSHGIEQHLRLDGLQ